MSTFTRSTRAPALWMAPPWSAAVLPSKTTFVNDATPWLSTAPPLPVDVLRSNFPSTIVNTPKFSTAPVGPSARASVMPRTVSLPVAKTWKSDAELPPVNVTSPPPWSSIDALIDL